MKHFIGFALKFDILGSNFRLQYKKQSTTKSLFGSFLSICLFILALISSFFFGREAFLREEPMTNMTQDYLKDNQISLKDSPIVLQLLDKNGQSILDTDLMESFSIVSFLYTIMVEQAYEVNTLPLFVEPCSADNMTPENYALLKQEGYDPNTFLCVDPFHVLVDGKKEKFDVYFRNPFGLKDSAFVAFALQKCDERLKPGCSQAFSKEDQIFMNQMVFESYIDFADFEKPAKRYLNNFAHEVSFSMFKRVYMKMALNTIFTDEGYIFKSERKFDFYSLEQTKIDVKIFSDNDPFYFDLFKEVSYKKNIYNRRYLKIQEVLANIGGFMKTVFFLCRFLVKYYSEYLFFVKFTKEFSGRTETKETKLDKTEPEAKQLSFWAFLKSRVFKVNTPHNSAILQSCFKYTDLHYLTTNIRKIEANQKENMPNSFRL